MPAALPDHLPRLREQVRGSARNLPGTYRMVSEQGEVLYVGKSKQVRTRLLSYFRAKYGEKGLRILGEAHTIEWEYEPSEFAALLRELELIKRYRPRHNVRHKRDGVFSFLKLSSGPAPKLLVVRRVTDDDGVYFGPFRGGRRISDAVRELNDVLRLRDCSHSIPIHFADQRELFMISRPPRCHRFELQRCAAPCAGGCTAAEYQGQVTLAKAFLAGDADEPLLWLAERMHSAADRLDYEYAASIRDRTQRLEMLREEFGRLREALDSLTFLYRVPGAEGDDLVYVIRRGTIRAVLQAPQTKAERRRLAKVAMEHFSAPEPEGAVVGRHQVEEILLLEHWFRTHPTELERTSAPKSSPALACTA